MCEKKYEDYGQRCSLCKECKRIYNRKVHKNRSVEAKQRKLKLQKERVLKNRIKLYKYFLENPCSACGESRVPCLQFHHSDCRKLGEKKFNIADTMSKSCDNIKKLINKCILLCANCHAVITAK